MQRVRAQPPRRMMRARAPAPSLLLLTALSRTWAVVCVLQYPGVLAGSPGATVCNAYTRLSACLSACVCAPSSENSNAVVSRVS